MHSIETPAYRGKYSYLEPYKGLFTSADFLGIGLDIILFWLFTYLNMAFNLSQISSLLVGAGIPAALKYKTSQPSATALEGRGWLWPAALTTLAALFLRAGLLAVLVHRALGLPISPLLFLLWWQVLSVPPDGGMWLFPGRWAACMKPRARRFCCRP